jgi:indole-3-glycerol phosphate synthase
VGKEGGKANMLTEIVSSKRVLVKSMSLMDMERARPLHDVVKSLSKKPLICEVKKASPSFGDLNPELDVAQQAKAYMRLGAGAVSVLTDEKYFKGSYQDLLKVSRAVEIPVMGKDFIISTVQIENAYLCGADLILLIASILSQEELQELSTKVYGLGMQILYELHDLDEYAKIADLKPSLIGVNARDLRTMKIDREKAQKTLSGLKGEFIKVAESGINTGEDIKNYTRFGAKAFLVGTALMKSENLEATFADLKKGL